ncbi:CbtA family protein [Pararhodobacter aggregans]|uniref:Cobalt transporter n=1 Tax=Pararhodobacter aggregans TaxID=404875 RepID=A0A2T7UJS2_9RHOB|nr:CbtA family protein [Pararhodobacter aggregans]PTW97525.1 cobalt transporter subunit CbtA [Pararhodobacter aggregans]PVE44914.1 cobalt transporter [Pararhodobacter aggregans]
MFQKMMTGALIAGIGAGLLAAVLHFAFIQNYILLGEQYETGELVHFAAPEAAVATHDHAEAADHGTAEPAASDHGAADHGAHEHGDGETSTIERNALTVGFTVLLYVAYGIMLTVGFAIAAQFGKRITATEGALWGLAGFAAFQLAPGMGLAPELPGSAAADLAARQVWWWSTVVATGLGIALIAYGRSLIATLAGAALIAAPHVVGAPLLDGYYGYAPTEVGAIFSSRVLGVGLAVWVVLGWLAGRQWDRSGAAA